MKIPSSSSSDASEMQRTELALQSLRNAVGVARAPRGSAKTSKVSPAVVGMEPSGKAMEKEWPALPAAALEAPAAAEASARGLADALHGVPGPPPGRPDESWREDPDYDPFSDRQVKLPYSDTGAASHLLKGSLGAGLLAISFGFKMSGLAVGIASGIAIAFICTHCARLLVINARRACLRLRVPSIDFPSTAEAAFLTAPRRFRKFARPCRFMVNFMLCFTYLGLPIIFIIVISSSVQQLMQYYLDVEVNLRIVIVVLVPFVMTMGLISELKWLVPFTLLSNFLFLVGFSICIYYVVRDTPDPSQIKQHGTLEQYPLFLSAMIYGMENIGVVLPVENTMRNPQHFLKPLGVLNVSMFIVALLYISIGAAGYLAFREATEANIIINLPLQEPAAQAVKLLVPLGILLSYGLQLYVVPLTLWSGVMHRVPQEKHRVGLILLRAACVSFTVIVALVVPNLRPVLALVGAVGFSSLGLLFPALIDMVMTSSNERTFSWFCSLVKNGLIISFWCVALLAGCYSAALEVIEEYFTPPKT